MKHSVVIILFMFSSFSASAENCQTRCIVLATEVCCFVECVDGSSGSACVSYSIGSNSKDSAKQKALNQIEKQKNKFDLIKNIKIPAKQKINN